MAPSLPILYSFRRCPYAMRARLALYWAKIDHQHREVSLKNKPPEMLEISPKGTVPVLLLKEGIILEESLDIMNWAFDTAFLSLDSSSSLNPLGQLSLENRQLITENETVFKPALDRYKYPGRYAQEKEINYRSIGEQFLKNLETQLGRQEATLFLAGNTMTLSDMALFPFIRQFAMVDLEWFNTQPYPRLNAWFNALASSQLFHQVMQKYPLWSPGDQSIVVAF